MKVCLAGITTGIDSRDTAEVLATTYARISRDPRPISEIREEARLSVTRAREINERVIFDMGHATIAEHVVFNIEIEGVSRLLVEEIERTRLASYTEKSQRYITLKGDFVLPIELNNDKDLENSFMNAIKRGNLLYESLCVELIPIVTKELGKGAPQGAIENRAKEDARYVLSMSTEAQLGMTINARSLVRMVKRLKKYDIVEFDTLADFLVKIAEANTPSVIKRTDPVVYDIGLLSNIAACEGVVLVDKTTNEKCKGFNVTLCSCSHLNPDKVIAEALLFSYYGFYSNFFKLDLRPDSEVVKNIIKAGLTYLDEHDSVAREFEMVDFTFEAIVTASCFAQLKRHRMGTILSQAYNLDLGYRLPLTFDEIDQSLLTQIKEMMNYISALYSEIKSFHNYKLAEYVLTNAHLRKVRIKMNMRELYHFSRLRCDSHAQWEIRELAESMIKIVKNIAPISSMLMGGKDQFPMLKLNKIIE